MSEVVPCADFVSDVSMESGAIMFYSPGWDMVFTVVYDDRSEIFGGCVYVSEVVYVKVCKLCVIKLVDGYISFTYILSTEDFFHVP